MKLICETLEGRLLFATNPAVMVANVNPSTLFGVDSPLAIANGRAFLFENGSDASISGLWTTDGTAAGTKRLSPAFRGLPVQINQALGGATTIDINGTFYFSGGDSRGAELWKSDGTPAGTTIIKDASRNDIQNIGMPSEFVNLNGTLYYTYDDWDHGRELWKSNGTAAGTVMVKDLVAGHDTSNPHDLTLVNGKIFFIAGRAQLWKTDGTAAGTVLVKDFGSSNGIPFNLTNLNGTLILAADDGTGWDLWRSDGTAAGTTKVKDFGAGNAGVFTNTAFRFAVIGGKTLLFDASTDGQHFGLWKSNGTTAGTSMLKTIVAIDNNGAPNSLSDVGGGVAYFSEYLGDGNHEIWKTDGTVAGTVRVKRISVGNGNRTFGGFTRLGNLVYFRGYETTHGVELWQTDGTDAGTFLAQDINPGAADSFAGGFVTLNSLMLFGADDGTHGPEVWKLPTNTNRILGAVFNDLDGDGVRDSGEGALAGVRVFLDADKDGVRDANEMSVVTDSAGGYVFTGLTAGTYRVRAVLASGQRATKPGAGYYDVTLGTSQTASAKDFGLTRKALLTGSVFNDLNGSGTRQSGETGLANWRVFIDADNDGVLDSGERSLLTDASGNWRFTDLAAGTYVIRVVQQSGWTRTAPAAGAFTVTLAAAQVSTGKLFGEKIV